MTEASVRLDDAVGVRVIRHVLGDSGSKGDGVAQTEVHALAPSGWVDMSCITDEVDHAAYLVAGAGETSPETGSDCAAGTETGVPYKFCVVPSVKRR